MGAGATAFLKLGSRESAVEFRSVYSTLLNFRVSLRLRGWPLPVGDSLAAVLPFMGSNKEQVAAPPPRPAPTLRLRTTGCPADGM